MPFAGFSGAVLALAGANAAPTLDALGGPARDAAGTFLLLGSLLLITALTAALRGSLSPHLVSDSLAGEVAVYASERLTDEPDLLRLHVRALHTLLASIKSMTRQADAAARTIRKSEYFFLAGLFTVGLAFATLIAVVTF